MPTQTNAEVDNAEAGVHPDHQMILTQAAEADGLQPDAPGTL